MGFILTFILWPLIFFAAGFIMESCICFYHRSRENNKLIQTAILSCVISLIGILVISRIVGSIYSSPLGYWALSYALIFALGKGSGTYLSLICWDKFYKTKEPEPHQILEE
jgi:hypothetical protein